MPGNAAYCVSKGGMRMLTRTAGVELAQYGITVTGVGRGPWTRRSTSRPRTTPWPSRG
jgi:NAD(P)-dependent dehydrogenase (short-subunit alcohol dehydrogenase family)